MVTFMAENLFSYARRLPYIRPAVEYKNLHSEYQRIVSKPLTPGVMKTIDIVIFGRRRMGKTTLQDRIAHDIVRSHPDNDVRVYVSTDFNALVEHVGEEGDIWVLILDDPLEKLLSRGGTTRAQKQGAVDYHMLAHRAEEKIRRNMQDAGRDWRTGLIYTITGSQEIKGLDKTFRAPSVMLFKSSIGYQEDDTIVQKLVGYHYFRKLKDIRDQVEIYDNRKLLSYVVGVIGERAGWLWLPPGPVRYHETCYVKPKHEKQLEEQRTVFERVRSYALEILQDPSFELDINTKHLPSLVYRYLVDKYGATTPDLYVFLKGGGGHGKGHLAEIVNYLKALLVTAQEQEKHAQKTTPTPQVPSGESVQSDNIYVFFLEHMAKDMAYWGDKHTRDMAIKILAEYMKHWRRGESPTQYTIAEAIGVSQDTVSRYFSKTDQHRPTILNYLQGPRGGRLFEAFRIRQKEAERPDIPVWGEAGNYHWPDIIDGEGNVESLKFACDQTKLARTRLIDIHKECKPEVSAAIDGVHRFYVGEKHVDGYPKEVRVKNTFRLVFCNLAWGPRILISPELDPFSVRAVRFSYPDKIEVIPLSQHQS